MSEHSQELKTPDSASAAESKPESSKVPPWVTPAIAITCIGLEVVALLISYYKDNLTLLSMVVGAIVVQGGTATNYYLGSSSGSQSKSETIASIKTPVN